MNKIGKYLKLTIFGTSHGPSIGITITGLKKGIKLDWSSIKVEMDRRKPGQNPLTTPRKEADEVCVLTGLKNNLITTGKPLKMIIKNTNIRPHDYLPILRPGHADWTALIKYHHVATGGGQFSGRLTAPIVFVGAIIKQVLKQEYGIEINSKISQIYHTTNPSPKQIAQLIKKAQMQKDSLGGTITLQAQHMIAGLGSDFFGGIEAKVSEYLFAIPGVKGVEFGDGFKLVEHYGSQTNDAIYIKQKKFYTKTNHMGGILGGISNGMDLVCKIAIKPTPSIGQPQHSVNYQTMQPTILATTGRHDPCIVLRAQVVAEAYLAIAIYELILANEKA